VWTAKRGNNAFDDTNVYFHLDQSQRYIQSLGFKNVNNRQQLLRINQYGGDIAGHADVEQVAEPLIEDDLGRDA